MDNKVTLTTYFKVKNSEIFDYKPGYALISVECNIRKLGRSYKDLTRHNENQIGNIASVMKVNEEDIEIVSRTEYESNAEDGKYKKTLTDFIM